MSCEHRRTSIRSSSSQDRRDVWDDVAKKWRTICTETTVERRVCDDCGSELSSHEHTRGC